MQCPKCGAFTSAALCPECRFVLDTSFVAAARAEPQSGRPGPSDGDAVILGDLGAAVWDLMGEDTGSYLTKNTGEVQRVLAPAPLYLGGDITEVLQPTAVLARTRNADARLDVLTPFERHVLDFIDGERPVARIRKLAEVSSGDVRIALAMLFEKRIVEITAVVQLPKLEADEGEDDTGPFEVEFVVPKAVVDLDVDGPTHKQASPFLPQPLDSSPSETVIPRAQRPAAVRPQMRVQPPVRSAREQQAFAPPSNPQRAEQLRLHALEDLAAGRVGRAWSWVRMALELDPDNEAIKAVARDCAQAPGGASSQAAAASAEERLYFEARQAEDAGDFQRAVELLARAIEKNPRRAPLHNHLGVVLATRLKRFDEATDALVRAVELDPANAVYKNNLGKVAAMADVNGADTDPGFLKKLFGS